MEYMGNSSWWNERFKNRTLDRMTHENLLEKDIKYFKSQGKLLDLACGDGRNAIYLSKLGYEVTAVDFSKEALNRLKFFMEEEEVFIKTESIDLSKVNNFDEFEQFDGIVINHYRLNPKSYIDLMKHLKQDGVLWVNGFCEIPEDNPNITKNDLIKDSDFLEIKSAILVDRMFYKVGDRNFVRYLWRKK